MQLHEELTLVVQAKKGEKAAIGTLWDDITPKLYGYLVNILRDTTLAEDMLQDTWLKAINNLSRFEPRGVRFSAWLFAIARNECRQHWRKYSHEILQGDDAKESPDTRATHTMIANNIFLEDILKKLSEEDQEILRFRFIAELNFKEVAQILGISIIAARVRVHRALEKARTLLT